MTGRRLRINAPLLAAALVFLAEPRISAQNPSAANLLQEAAVAPTKQALQKKTRHRKQADEFFAGPVVDLEFKFKPEEWESLKKDNRRYTECTIVETTPGGKKTEYKKAAVKLKGAAGSFQGPDGKPGLTISCDRFKGADRFHGMDKFHLNNGAQDGSLLNEYIGGEMCRTAGVPASRCTHVMVKWNGRDLGLYLFKEAFTKDFLSYFFARTDGSLYDGHFIAEVDGNLEKQQGGDPADTTDLKELAAACKEGDTKARWFKIFTRLDVDEFLRSLAMETFLCHWDGYNFNRNNYRVYFDPKTGKANFFIHGIDQIFGDANWPVLKDPGSLVGQAVWSNPEWKAHYMKVANAIYQKVLKPVDWEARIQQQGRKIQDGLNRQNPQAAKDYQGQINAARDRVLARLASIGKQFGEIAKPLEWMNNTAPLGGVKWRPDGAGTMDEQTVDGRRCLHLRTDTAGNPSWRHNITLPPGRYRFQAVAKVANAEGGGDASGVGAGLRTSGGSRTGSNGLTGTTAWQKLGFEFDAVGSDTVLVAEFRAAKGEAWFQADSLQLVRLK